MNLQALSSAYCVVHFEGQYRILKFDCLPKSWGAQECAHDAGEPEFR